MALVRRKLKATFVLGEGAFGADGADTLTIEGLRMSARISNAGGRSMGTADLQIWGMTLHQMNKLSTLGMVVTAQRRNSVTVAAGDDLPGAVMSTVFQGTIRDGYGDFNSAPEVPFNIAGFTGLADAIVAAEPISIKGSADVANMLSGIATKMGLAFNNSGVTAKLSNPYYAGSPRQQAVAIVKDAGIEWNGGENATLAIWNAGGSRGDAAVLLSKGTGMEGYPTYTSNGIMVRSLFNPSIGLGSKIEVKSILEPANGLWVVYKLDHDLAADMPDGAWQTTVLAAREGLGPFVA